MAGPRRRTERPPRSAAAPSAGRGRITHRFRPRQLEDRRPNKLGQHVGRRPARAIDRREIELAPAGVADLTFLDRGEPEPSAESRRSPVAGAPTRGPRRSSQRPAALRDPVGNDREPARRYIAAHLSRRDSAAASLSRNSPVSSSIARRCMPAGISSDNSSSSNSPPTLSGMEEQVQSRDPASHASQHALASARTRQI